MSCSLTESPILQLEDKPVFRYVPPNAGSSAHPFQWDPIVEIERTVGHLERLSPTLSTAANRTRFHWMSETVGTGVVEPVEAGGVDSFVAGAAADVTGVQLCAYLKRCMRAIDGGLVSFKELEQLRALWEDSEKNDKTFLARHGKTIDAVLFQPADRARVLRACLRAAKVVLHDPTKATALAVVFSLYSVDDMTTNVMKNGMTFQEYKERSSGYNAVWGAIMSAYVTRPEGLLATDSGIAVAEGIVLAEEGGVAGGPGGEVASGQGPELRDTTARVEGIEPTETDEGSTGADEIALKKDDALM
ncbi:hypothetical protein HK101_010282 [Irineochytrium annulatum]|nr:hypothetical protein HK101_010282 [Irineochytrium annulatum]